MNHKKIFMFSRTVLGSCTSKELHKHNNTSVENLLKQFIITDLFQSSPSLIIPVHVCFILNSFVFSILASSYFFVLFKLEVNLLAATERSLSGNK